MLNTNLCWLPSPNSKADIRLFCFPYAGGSASTYISWLNNIDESIELVLIQPPGRGARFAEAPLNTMSAMVDKLMESRDFITNKPFVFFGHSLGSRVAYELCCKLAMNGNKLPEFLIASASKAPHLPIEHETTFNLPDKLFQEKLRELNGTPQEIIENDELISILTPMLKADFSIAETHQSVAIKLPIPLLILAGENDNAISQKELYAWEDLTQEKCEFANIKGDHFFIDKCKIEVLIEVNKVIKRIRKVK